VTTYFSVHGPVEVPVYEGIAGRAIAPDNIEEFWKANPSLKSRRGCYVFGIRAGGGFTPGYVGKATKSFKQEVFTGHKLAKYHQFLVDYAKGTPVLFFLLYPAKKGKPNTKHIAALENHLIQLGMTANQDLLNVKGTQVEEWGITGMLRAARGKPSKATRYFKTMMKSS
jgi:hypothetical protein